MAKLFLAGACFVAVGCTDYADDIQNLNDRIDTLETGTIDPLKADLAKVQENLAAAQEAITAQKAKHEEDVAELRAADQALQEAVNAAAKKAAEDLAALSQELKAADSALAASLEQKAAELNAAIAATNAKVAENEQAIAAAVKKAADDLAALSQELKAADAALAQKIDAEVAALNAALAETNGNVKKNADAIAALEAALAAAKSEMAQALADAKAELSKAIADGDAAVKSELEAKIAALDTALNSKIDTLEADLESQIAATNADVANNAAAILSLQNALNEAKAALEKAIADGDAKLAQDILDLETKLTALVKDYVDDLQDQINTLVVEISHLIAKDKEHDDKIAALQTALENTNAKVEKNVQDIAALNSALAKAIADSEARDEALGQEIADLAQQHANDIAALEDDLATHIEEYLLFKSSVEADIAALEAEVAALHAKDVELAGLIEALDVRLEANEELAAKNAEDIAANKAEFDAYVEATAETLKLLNDAIIALGEDFDAYKVEIREELKKHYAAFDQYMESTNNSIAALKEDIRLANVLIGENKDAIKKNTKLINDVAERLKTQVDALNSRIDQVIADYEAADKEIKQNLVLLDKKVEAYNEATKVALAKLNAKDFEHDGKIKANEEAIALLKSAVKDLEKGLANLKLYVDEEIDKLDTKFQNLINDLAGSFEALRDRVQSLVYVPEYTDGKATIEYAIFGNKIIECNSVLTYQVHPAECAGNGVIRKEDLAFLFKELKSRANAPEFEIVKVEADSKNADKGYINVTVQAHNLGDNFYQPDATTANGALNYAVSLVFNNYSETTNVSTEIASSYTSLIAEAREDVDQISMGIINKDGKLIHGADAQPSEEYTIIYSDLEDSVEFMNSCLPVFKVGADGEWYTYSVITSQGYQIGAPEQSISYNYFDKDGNEDDTYKDVFKNVEAGEGYKYVTSSLAKVEKLAVKSYETVTYTFAADGNEVNTVGKLTIVKDQATVELGEATINWNRDMDNLKPNFARENVEYALTDEVLKGLEGKNTTYAEAVAGTLTKLVVTVDEKEIDILANTWDEADANLFAELEKVAAEDENALLDLEGFAWNKTYNFTALYELDNIDVTVKFAVKTVLPLYEIVLEPFTINWNYAQDWQSTQGTTVTMRELTPVVVKTATENAPEYAVVVAGLQNSLQQKNNGKEVADLTYEFAAEAITVKGFVWNIDYTYEAEYALEDALVTISGSVATEREHLRAVITLPESTQDIEPDMTINAEKNAINDDLVAALNAEANATAKANLRMGDMEVADYLTAIFNSTLPVATPVENKRTDKDGNVVDATDLTTLLVAENGQSVGTYFSWTDKYSPLPDKVEYSYIVKTWYGAEIEFVKVLNFDLDTYNQYDYKSVSDFVYEVTETSYYSRAIPYYSNEDGTEYMYGLVVELDMDTAFNVVGANNVIIPANELAANNLRSTFAEKHEVDGDGIQFYGNTLAYHGKTETIPVEAKLELINSDGTTAATIPTEFDKVDKTGEVGAYNSYYVEKYDPIQLDVETTPIQFFIADDARTYINYVMNGFQLFDKRLNKNNNKKGYNLVEKGHLIEEGDSNYDSANVEWTMPEWVVGDSSLVNGYANGYSVADIYGLKVRSWKLTADSEAKLVDLISAGALVFENDPTIGKITFKNRNQIQLTGTVLFEIEVIIDYTWGERKATVQVELNKAVENPQDGE